MIHDHDGPERALLGRSGSDRLWSAGARFFDRERQLVVLVVTGTRPAAASLQNSSSRQRFLYVFLDSRATAASAEQRSNPSSTARARAHRRARFVTCPLAELRPRAG